VNEMMEKKINETVTKIHMLCHEIMEIENHTMHFGTDQKLTREEIHLIKRIGAHPGNHVIGLAKDLGITKAAVSSKLKRLERKGMIIKEKDPRNLSRLNIGLTEQGYVAYRAHEAFHSRFDKIMVEIFDGYSKEEIAFLIRFVTNSKAILSRFNENERS
jgi:DNA-binding MarR family transcriptional regulator